MDKSTFIERAPEYYALGLAWALLKTATRSYGPRTIEELGFQFMKDDSVFKRQALVAQGIKILIDANVVSLITDDFGPTVYQARPNLQNWMDSVQDQYPSFGKFAAIGSEDWLHSAIRSVNEQYDILKIQPSDFTKATNDEEWEPIPLDRSDPKLQAATEAIDQAIESVEADNGYAVTHPGEREYVLSGLKTVRTLLKQESQIYWMQIRTFAIEPLNRAIKRFGPAALGLVLRAAKDALFDWLKEHVHKALDWF